uniref:Oxidoreductase molybdopterin-binding domain-containing protein n=1 Tax=Solibacter usitatus (strain Ellin6076) TaxID=234267 RepID=Q01QA6_SOLUE
MRRFAFAFLVAITALPDAGPALSIEGVTPAALQLTLADLSAMPRARAVVAEHIYEGVLVYDVLKKAGQPLGAQLRSTQLMKYAVLTGHDGYRALFSLPEFDPAFTSAGALIADRMDGKPIPERKGPLWLVLPDEKTGVRSVYMLERIQIQTAP